MLEKKNKLKNWWLRNFNIFNFRRASSIDCSSRFEKYTKRVGSKIVGKSRSLARKIKLYPPPDFSITVLYFIISLPSRGSRRLGFLCFYGFEKKLFRAIDATTRDTVRRAAFVTGWNDKNPLPRTGREGNSVKIINSNSSPPSGKGTTARDVRAEQMVPQQWNRMCVLCDTDFSYPRRNAVVVLEISL